MLHRATRKHQGSQGAEGARGALDTSLHCNFNGKEHEGEQLANRVRTGWLDQLEASGAWGCPWWAGSQLWGDAWP